MYIVRSKKKTILLFQKNAPLPPKYYHTLYLLNAVSDWLTLRLADWITDWSCDWLTDWLADMLTDWLAYQHTVQLTGSLVQLLIGCFTDKLINNIDWQSQTDRLSMTAGSLTNWLDWLADILRFMLRKESRLLIANEDGEFFISDQMTVSSRCPKTSAAKILSLSSVL